MLGDRRQRISTTFETQPRRNRWDTRRQAEGAIFQYINGFYNPRRRHSSLGGKSPLAFERKAA